VSFEPIALLKPNELWKVGIDEKNTDPKGKSKGKSKEKSKGNQKAKRVRLSKEDDNGGEDEDNEAGKSQDMEM
jgi:hypothetical protein